MATKPKSPPPAKPQDTPPASPTVSETKANESPSAQTETAAVTPPTYTVTVPNSRYEAVLNGVTFRRGVAVGVPEPLAKRFERELLYEIEAEGQPEAEDSAE